MSLSGKISDKDFAASVFGLVVLFCPMLKRVIEYRSRFLGFLNGLFLVKVRILGFHQLETGAFRGYWRWSIFRANVGIT